MKIRLILVIGLTLGVIVIGSLIRGHARLPTTTNVSPSATESVAASSNYKFAANVPAFKLPGELNSTPVDAVDDNYTVHIYGRIGPFSNNDSGPNGPGFDSYRVVTLPTHGTINPVDNDNPEYRHEVGFTGTDSFTYEICELGECDTATVTINVVNLPPVAVDDRYEVTAPYGRIGIFSSNDDDTDDSAFETFRIVTLPSHGRIEPETSDAPLYYPDEGYTGPDSLVYEVCDVFNACSTATVYINDDDANAGPNACNARVGEPINMTNGNAYLQQTDFQLPSVGLGIAITRTYNSSSLHVNLFGRGWSSAYDESLTQFSNTKLRLLQSDGRAVDFILASANTYNPVQQDFHGQVLRSGTGYTLSMKNGDVHEFNTRGKLLSLRDSSGHLTLLSYDANGNLASVTDPFGRMLTVTSNAAGRVTSISDTMGTIATYTYGGYELLSVTYADNSGFQFAYDSNLRLTSVTDALGHIVESHTYDAQGRALTSEVEGGVEHYTLNYLSSAETDVTDALGRVTKYTIDKTRGRNVVTRVEGLCDCGGASSQVQTWDYDSQLNVTAETNALNHTFTFTYDADGNRLTQTDASGTVSFTYNQFGEVLTRTDQLNSLTTNTYDAAGNPLSTTNALGKTTNFSYDTRGLLLAVTDARGKVTSFAYDSNGNLTGKTDALGHTTRFDYDARGQLAFVVNALGHLTVFVYDFVGRLTQVAQADGTSIVYQYDIGGRRIAMTDAKGNRTTYAYDGANRLTSETDALNQSTSYSYDPMSNLTSRTAALGRVVEYEYDDFNRLKKVTYPAATSGAPRLFETLAYDAAGNVTQRTDPAGRVTSYAYDELNRTTSTTDADNKVTSFEYDALGRTTALVDALSQRYRFNYDAVGQLRNVRRGATVMSFTYDAVGNRKTRTDYNGVLTTYDYDALNRLKTINYPDASTAGYTYDKLSRLQTATNENGVIDFDYNKMNRLTSVTDVFGQVIDYNYDPNGNRTKLMLNAATLATYRYDAGDRLTKLLDNAGAAFNFTYDATNKLTSQKAPNGVTASEQYDGLDRLTRLTNKKGQTTIADFQYGFNDANNISQIIDGAATNGFGYDLVDRLTSAAHSNQPNESYSYDQAGNRTSSHLSATYSHQPFNRLVSTSSATYTYDTNGNLISKTDASGTTQYAWDFENRLKQVTLPNGNVVAYKYDALGRRIERSATVALPLPLTTTERFIYDGADVVRDLDGNGQTTADYINGLGIDDKLRQTNAAGAALYFLQDHLGSTRALTNANGIVVEQLTYDSFGNSGASALTRYDYTGRERDPDTGLLYYRARYYDPQLGRFISEDPIGFAGGDLNLYGYVVNNPPNFRDPTGRQRADRDRPGDIEWARGLKKAIDRMPIPPRQSSCCNKTWTDCYAQCIENHRLDNLLPALGSKLPKRLLPPFRVVKASQPLTTIPSTIQHYIPTLSFLRGPGRLVSNFATPVTVFEGYYDLGLLVSCADLCERNPCN